MEPQGFSTSSATMARSVPGHEILRWVFVVCMVFWIEFQQFYVGLKISLQSAGGAYFAMAGELWPMFDDLVTNITLYATLCSLLTLFSGSSMEGLVLAVTSMVLASSAHFCILAVQTSGQATKSRGLSVLACWALLLKCIYMSLNWPNSVGSICVLVALMITLVFTATYVLGVRRHRERIARGWTTTEEHRCLSNMWAVFAYNSDHARCRRESMQQGPPIILPGVWSAQLEVAGHLLKKAVSLGLDRSFADLGLGLALLLLPLAHCVCSILLCVAAWLTGVIPLGVVMSVSAISQLYGGWQNRAVAYIRRGWFYNPQRSFTNEQLLRFSLTQPGNQAIWAMAEALIVKIVEDNNVGRNNVLAVNVSDTRDRLGHALSSTPATHVGNMEAKAWELAWWMTMEPRRLGPYSAEGHQMPAKLVCHDAEYLDLVPEHLQVMLNSTMDAPTTSRGCEFEGQRMIIRNAPQQAVAPGVGEMV